MQLKEKVTINASPGQVWPFIADPVLQAAWNTKIVSIDRPVDGPLKLGDRYNMIAKMSGKESTSHAEAIDVLADKRLTIRHHVEDKGAVQVVTETYDLHAHQNSTRVTQIIDLSGTNLPWFVRPLIWLIMTFGKPTSEPQLITLKRLIESEVGA